MLREMCAIKYICENNMQRDFLFPSKGVGPVAEPDLLGAAMVVTVTWVGSTLFVDVFAIALVRRLLRVAISWW